MVDDRLIAPGYCLVMARHERFDAWQRCHQLVLSIYEASAAWPIDERFGLVSQVRRAAVSAPSNLAEGAAKRGSKELGRYLDMSNGSLAEVQYLLRLAKDLGYLNSLEHERLGTLLNEAARSVWLLYAAVRRRANPT